MSIDTTERLAYGPAQGLGEVVGFDLRMRGGLMANVSASGCGPSGSLSLTDAREEKQIQRSRNARTRLIFLAAVVFLAPLIFAQSTPQVTGVDPQSGKVNDSVTVSGQNLGKDAVSAVYLSDDKNDYRATVVQQTAEKIVMKIPQVKPANYNVSIQVGDKLFIKPVRFKVEE
jgi:translation initiation factor IF-2